MKKAELINAIADKGGYTKKADLFRQLNQEGREKAIDQLDTMVLTGKYLPGTARLSWLQKRQGKEVRT